MRETGTRLRVRESRISEITMEFWEALCIWRIHELAVRGRPPFSVTILGYVPRLLLLPSVWRIRLDCTTRRWEQGATQGRSSTLLSGTPRGSSYQEGKYSSMHRL